ncbi:RNA-binding protein [Candidatus Dojkabacteria bacterium]|nr:RNA-binding protein [Candidatus Dojkabacteria bacterium]
MNDMNENNDQNSKLFVGGLSWDTTEEGLRTFFEQVGEVKEVKIIVHRDTGKSRGFGFVTMATEEEAQKAIEELNEQELDGRTLKVAEARPREER